MKLLLTLQQIKEQITLNINNMKATEFNNAQQVLRVVYNIADVSNFGNGEFDKMLFEFATDNLSDTISILLDLANNDTHSVEHVKHATWLNLKVISSVKDSFKELQPHNEITFANKQAIILLMQQAYDILHKVYDEL